MGVPKETVKLGNFTEQAYGFSQAVKVGDTVYVAGQTAFGEEGIVGVGDMATQMREAYAAIGRVLARFGAGYSNVVDETLFVTDTMAAATVALEVRGRGVRARFRGREHPRRHPGARRARADGRDQVHRAASEPVTSPADPVQLLVDRDEIHDLVMRYARGVDTRDMEAVRSCFAPDCDVSRWGPGMTDREAMIDYISGVGHFHTTMHMMGNQFVEVDGDAGQVDSYAMLTHHSDDRAGRTHQMNMNGSRYVERVARRDGRWVVTQRGGEPRWAPIGVTGAVTDDPATQWLLDRAEIHDLMMQYALGVDLRDYDAHPALLRVAVPRCVRRTRVHRPRHAGRVHLRCGALPLDQPLPRHPARRGRAATTPG